MNINTRQLRAAVLVGEQRSFTKAADSMHITQAGLSALIKELESQLGFRLFERTTRRVTLTEQGTQFLLIARSVEQCLLSGVRDIAGTLSGIRRTLRVAASPIMVSGILPHTLKRHAARFPEDRIELLDVSRSEVLPEVEKGNADLGLGIFFRPVSGVRQYRLFSSSLLLISPKDTTHSEAEKTRKSIPMSDIPARALIRLSSDNPFQQWVDDRLLAASNLPADTDSMRLRNIESCVAMVETGNGHFIAPDFVAPVCSRYDVSIRTIHPQAAGVDFYAITRTGADPGPIAKDFTDSLLKTLVARNIGKQYGTGLA